MKSQQTVSLYPRVCFENLKFTVMQVLWSKKLYPPQEMTVKSQRCYTLNIPHRFGVNTKQETTELLKISKCSASKFNFQRAFFQFANIYGLVYKSKRHFLEGSGKKKALLCITGYSTNNFQTSFKYLHTKSSVIQPWTKWRGHKSYHLTLGYKLRLGGEDVESSLQFYCWLLIPSLKLASQWIL